MALIRSSVLPIRSGATALPVFMRHGWLLFIVALHQSATLLVAAATGTPTNSLTGSFLSTYMGLLVPAFLVGLLAFRILRMAIVVRPQRPLHFLAADLKAVLFDGDRMLQGIIALFVVLVFFPNFSVFKEAIPQLLPFSWDATISQADRLLHFGFNPYELLLPVFGNPYVITALNAVYHFWFFLLTFILFLACFTKAKPLARMTFLLAFFLTWAVWGNLAAVLMSSAGPVYFAGLGLGDTYQPLMDHLQAASTVSPVWALGVQDMLWAGYTGNGPVIGISAMPSMHVASSTLLMLYAYTWSRLAGRIMVGFLILIMVGSVVLGWHYALDGYLGVLFAVLTWRFAARIAERLDVTGRGAVAA